jgi:type I restriction enzyme S subunit
MKTYEKYKSSGIEWMGDIPEHWKVKPVKLCFEFSTGFTPSTGNSEYFDGDNPWINISDLKDKYINEWEKNISDEAIEKYNASLVSSGSLLFSFKLSIGRVAFAKNDLYTNEAIFSIFPNKEINLNFFYYSLPIQIIENAIHNIYGAKMLNQELIKNAKILIPTKDEQTAIANFLDIKTTAIDQSISDKEKLITLLEEEKKALINEAVTKGINKAVKLKNSGIDWLGDIPKHWEVKKLKYVLKSLNNIRVPLSSEVRGDMLNKIYDYYGASGVIDKVEDYLFDEPLLLIGEDGANLLSRSSRLVFIAEGKYWVNNHAHILKPIFGKLKFYCEALEQYDFSIWVTGSAQPKLTSENLMNIEIPVPPLQEQIQIVQYIETESQKIDGKIALIKEEIALLKEYRGALIFEAVTGKIDVKP